MRKALHDFNGGIMVGGQIICNLRYADDTTLICDNREDLQLFLNAVKGASEATGLLLNTKKTKVMAIGERSPTPLTVNGEAIDEVKEFNFLGAYITSDGGCGKEINRRICMAKSAAISLSKIWRSRDIARQTKKRLMESLVFSIALYGSESWTLKKNHLKKLNGFEMWCWRRLLGIRWVERRTNESVLEQMGNPESLCNSIINRQMTYFGHIMRRNNENLEKAILTGKIQGRRGRGRPRRTWIDGIKDFTNKNLNEIKEMCQDRGRWRQLTVEVTRGRPRP